MTRASAPVNFDIGRRYPQRTRNPGAPGRPTRGQGSSATACDVSAQVWALVPLSVDIAANLADEGDAGEQVQLSNVMDSGPQLRVIHKVLDQLNRGAGCSRRPTFEVFPVGGPEVFDHIPAVRTNGRVKHVERSPDVSADMAAVINDDVESAIARDQSADERCRKSTGDLSGADQGLLVDEIHQSVYIFFAFGRDDPPAAAAINPRRSRPTTPTNSSR
jgi:hypothetical protein